MLVEPLRLNSTPPVDSVSLEPSAKPASELERAIRAEQGIDALKYRQHNVIFHRDNIIENLKKRVLEQKAALAEAQDRIMVLETEKSTKKGNKDEEVLCSNNAS